MLWYTLYTRYSTSLVSLFRQSGASLIGSSQLFELRSTPVNAGWLVVKGGYLVDPASSHMLVSKIKPCMSKYKHTLL